jgi:NADPH:quinone reductase-like Zn-dependent oxidoreductase
MFFFDVVANQNFAEAKKLLKKKGTFVTTQPSPKTFVFNEIKSWFSTKKYKFIVVRPSTEDLNILRALVEQGRLTTVIDKTFSLEEIGAAHAYGETMRTKGKIAISINANI